MSNNNTALTINEVEARLSELISNMPEAEKRELLNELEKRHKITEKRKHPRKHVFHLIDCSGQNYAFTDFIQNISASGLFIETNFPIFINQELCMIFTPSATEGPIKITGKIVRVDPKGFAVKFDETLQRV